MKFPKLDVLRLKQSVDKTYLLYYNTIKENKKPHHKKGENKMYAMVYEHDNKRTESHAEAVALGIEKFVTFVEVEAPIGSEEMKFNEKAEKANLENRKRRMEAGLPVRKK